MELDWSMSTEFIDQERRDETPGIDVGDGGEDTFVGLVTDRLDDARTH